MDESKYIHNTSIIDENCQIGEGTKIWHWTHISSNVQIGKNCILGQNVFVGSNVKIGNNVKIQNNVSVYSGVILENDVFCGPSMVFTNVSNPRSAIEKKEEFKTTKVKKGATIGANVTIICGLTIGEYALIGAGSLVSKNVKNYSLNFGNPSVHRGWVSKTGDQLDLPLVGQGEAECIKTKKKYILKDGAVIESK